VEREIQNLVQKLASKDLPLDQRTHDKQVLLEFLYSITRKILQDNSDDQLLFVDIALLFEKLDLTKYWYFIF
jgi:hypothetical protein